MSSARSFQTIWALTLVVLMAGIAPERSEAHAVQVRVVLVVDEDLCRPGVGAGGGEGDHAPRVGLSDRVVGDPESGVSLVRRHAQQRAQGPSRGCC